MWTSVWREKIRHARRLSPKIRRFAHAHRRPPHHNICFLQTHSAFPRGVAGDRFRGVSLRLRPYPSDLRLRDELPYPKVPPGAKHRCSECLHCDRHSLRSSSPKLARCLQARVGFTRGVSRAQPLVVDHSGGSVRLYCDE